jgi:hypothetical protein
LVLNVFVSSWLFGVLRRACADLAFYVFYVKERDLWMKRDEWIRRHQPTFENPAEASILLEGLKQVAGKQNVLIQNPVIGSSEMTPTHKAVFASIETKGPLPPVVHFSLRRAATRTPVSY